MTVKEKEKLYEVWSNYADVQRLWKKDGNSKAERDYMLQTMGMETFLIQLGLYHEFMERYYQSER